MPTSNLAIWPDILSAINQVPHVRVLDVGPGHGKASVLLREYLTEVPEIIDAVEMWEPYVDRFGLERLYDRVFVGDVTAGTWCLAGQVVAAQPLLERYDLVLLGDVIEHLALDAGLELLGRVPGRIVMCTPADYFDNDPYGIHPPTERHISHWTPAVWDQVGKIRPLEVLYQTLGGWIARVGPLTSAARDTTR